MRATMHGRILLESLRSCLVVSEKWEHCNSLLNCTHIPLPPLLPYLLDISDSSWYVRTTIDVFFPRHNLLRFALDLKRR